MSKVLKDFSRIEESVPQEYCDFARDFLINEFPKLDQSFIKSKLNEFNFHLYPTFCFIFKTYFLCDCELNPSDVDKHGLSNEVKDKYRSHLESSKKQKLSPDEAVWAYPLLGMELLEISKKREYFLKEVAIIIADIKNKEVKQNEEATHQIEKTTHTTNLTTEESRQQAIDTKNKQGAALAKQMFEEAHREFVTSAKEPGTTIGHMRKDQLKATETEADRKANGGKINVHVQILDGRTINLIVDLSNTVNSVKEKLEEKQNIPVADQRLVFGGKELIDDRTLQDYDVVEEATLFLVLRLK